MAPGANDAPGSTPAVLDIPARSAIESIVDDLHHGLKTMEHWHLLSGPPRVERLCR
jgi:hypothetical protein